MKKTVAFLSTRSIDNPTSTPEVWAIASMISTPGKIGMLGNGR